MQTDQCRKSVKYIKNRILLKYIYCFSHKEISSIIRISCLSGFFICCCFSFFVLDCECEKHRLDSHKCKHIITCTPICLQTRITLNIITENLLPVSELDMILYACPLVHKCSSKTAWIYLHFHSHNDEHSNLFSITPYNK